MLHELVGIFFFFLNTLEKPFLTQWQLLKEEAEVHVSNL